MALNICAAARDAGIYTVYVSLEMAMDQINQFAQSLDIKPPTKVIRPDLDTIVETMSSLINAAKGNNLPILFVIDSQPELGHPTTQSKIIRHFLNLKKDNEFSLIILNHIDDRTGKPVGSSIHRQYDESYFIKIDGNKRNLFINKSREDQMYGFANQKSIPLPKVWKRTKKHQVVNSQQFIQEETPIQQELVALV